MSEFKKRNGVAGWGDCSQKQRGGRGLGNRAQKTKDRPTGPLQE